MVMRESKRQKLAKKDKKERKAQKKLAQTEEKRTNKNDTLEERSREIVWWVNLESKSEKRKRKKMMETREEIDEEFESGGRRDREKCVCACVLGGGFPQG